MSIDALEDFVHRRWTKDWAQEATDRLVALWDGRDPRYPKAAASKTTVRAPGISPENGGVPFAALINPKNPDSGPYGGASFVIFPHVSGPALFGLVVGTQGLAPDEEILGRPGHARKAQAISRWLAKKGSQSKVVSWSKGDPTRIDESIPKPTKAAMSEHSAALDRYGNVLYAIFVPSPDHAVTRDALAAYLDLFFSEHSVEPLADSRKHAEDLRSQWMQEVLAPVNEDEVGDLLQKRKYVILAGPPGTGKTRLARKLVAETYQNNGTTIQFHPNTTYESFVGGLAPITTDVSVGLSFAEKAGHLMKAAEAARSGGSRPYLLHIDEINRADLSKVLGEAIYLLEPREQGRAITLPYSFAECGGTTFSLPENLHIVGTMNTADRSIAIVDVAVRRRFSFVHMWPDISVVKREGGDVANRAFGSLLDLFVEYASDEAFNLMPGHSYFLDKDDEEARRSLRSSLIPLLKEYIEQGYVAGFASAVSAFIQFAEAL